MKMKLLVQKTFVLAIFVMGCGLAAYSFATPALSQPAVGSQQRTSSFVYAQLTVQGDNQVTFDDGGGNVPRVGTLDATYRRLGGSQRTSLVNLLNVIGRSGWELVVADGNVWTFKRRN